MNLNMNDWKKFILKDIFNIKYGVNLELNSCEETSDENAIAFVSRTESNNGVSARVCAKDGLNPQKEGLITVAGGGSVLSTFVQPEPFYSGRDLYILEVKEDVSQETKLFLTTLISANKYKYNYGRQANKTLPFIEINLPIQNNADGTPFFDVDKKYSDDGYVPDWKFMEDYIKSLHHKPLTTNNKRENVLHLDVENWKEFIVGDFFDIHPTKSLKDVTSSDCVEGGMTPLVVNQSYNNGVAGSVNCKPTEKGGIITFSDTWEGETFFYQRDDFIGFSHVQGMYPRQKMCENVLLFMSTILEFEASDRYSYGRKKRRDLIKKSYIKLPIKHNADGTPFIDEKHTYSKDGYVPDWQFMEDYIKSLPYGDRL